MTHEEIVERARALAPAIAGRAAATEQGRAPDDDTIRELIEAELFSILVPPRWGGLGLGIETHREVVEIISATCMSTGWITAFYSGHNFLACKFPETAQEEFFAGRGYAMIPLTAAPTMTVEPEEGGVRVSGRASWGSGIMHADWVAFAAVGTTGDLLMVAVHADEVTVEDVWRMEGMAGTGSNDYVVDDVFVPEHRVVDLIAFAEGDTEGARVHEERSYRMAMMPFLHVEAVPVFVGGLRGAVTAFEEMVRNRVTSHAGTVVAEDPHAHLLLGEALTAASVAERLMADQVDQTVAIAAARSFTLEDRVALKGQAAFLVDHCRRTVNELVHHAGTTNFATDAPLQRFWRDINMLSTHAFWNWSSTREQRGRHALGLDITTPLI